MRASYEAYEEVAEHCSEFSPVTEKNSFSNSTRENEEVSCINCGHFDEDKFCKLDLYDQIVQNRNIDEK